MRPLLLFALLAAGTAGAVDISGAMQQRYDKNAAELFARAQRYVIRGSSADALEKFALLVKHYPRSPLAGDAQWQVARLYAESGEYEAAFDAAQLLIDHFPAYFEKALAMQYRLAREGLERYDHLLRTPDVRKPKDLPPREQVSAMLRIIIKNAPHGTEVADAQYLLGIALEKEGRTDEARENHETFVEKFPNHELADDACYQVAYIDWKLWHKMKGQAPQARERADVQLLWFLAKYPQSDKAAQARSMLFEVMRAQRTELEQLCEFYEKQGNLKSAAVYLITLIKKFPEVLQKEETSAKLSLWLSKFPELAAMNKEATEVQPGKGAADPVAYDPVKYPLMVPPSAK